MQIFVFPDIHVRKLRCLNTVQNKTHIRREQKKLFFLLENTSYWGEEIRNIRLYGARWGGVCDPNLGA